MLSIHVERNAEHSEVATDDEEVTIGRDPGSTVVLRDPEVSRQHCRLFERDGMWWVVDAGSERGTFVNGRRIAVATPLKESDRIGVGPCVLSIEVVPDTLDEPGTAVSDHRRPRANDVEGKLIADILGGDDVARAVYADWLEQQGRWVDAEFLRLQFSPKQMKTSDPAFERTTKRLRELSGTVDMTWRMKIARAAVDGCGAAFEATCPADWAAMAETADPTVRACNRCKRFVHYCRSEDEAFAQERRGGIVALDIAVVRHPAPQRPEIPCPRCGRLNSDHYKFCLGCAADLAPPAPAPAPAKVSAHTVPRTNANTIRRPPSSPPPVSLEEQVTSPRRGGSSSGEHATTARPSSVALHEPAARPSREALPEPAATARPSRPPESLGEPATTARPSRPPESLGEPATTARPNGRRPEEQSPFLDASDSFSGEAPTHLRTSSPPQADEPPVRSTHPLDEPPLRSTPMRPLDDSPPTHLRSSEVPRPTGEQRTTAWTGDPLTTARPGSPRVIEPATGGDDDELATVARPSARRPPSEGPSRSSRSSSPNEGPSRSSRPSSPNEGPSRSSRSSSPNEGHSRSSSRAQGEPRKGPQICPTCESKVPANFVFCGTCGARMR